MEELTLNIVGDVKKLDCKPGDVIVVLLPAEIHVTPDDVARIIQSWQVITELPNPVFVLVRGADVKVVKRGE
jgi:hypothetical protein